MASFSRPRQKRSRPSRPIPSIWGPRSASSRCCTPGGRTSSGIPICTAWPRWRVVTGWPTLDILPTRFLFTRPGSLTPVSPPIPGALAEGLRFRQIAFLCRLGILAPTRRLRSTGGPHANLRLGGVRQAALRRTAAGPRLRGPLYAPGGDFQQPFARYRKRSGPLSVEGLSGRRQEEDDNLVRRRVHSAFLATRIAEWIPTDPLLRSAGQPLPKGEIRAEPGVCSACHPHPRRPTYRPWTETTGTAARNLPATRCINVRNASKAVCAS